MVIEDCQKIFLQREEFRSYSNSIEVFGFKWYLQATIITKQSGWLKVTLHAKAPDGFNGPFRTEIDLLA
jgi:hypothetical protein